ncbi:hypothetical protein RN001_011392 [Aquatica leii]|uniref:Secreted protein n=1 Tax=Aquatica leii TaxID=1421715 RepID=A0AAN7PCA8_9COLE|nr:hypothetical protein RN001_011392 [Aquatica leii]
MKFYAIGLFVVFLIVCGVQSQDDATTKRSSSRRPDGAPREGGSEPAESVTRPRGKPGPREVYTEKPTTPLPTPANQ